MLKSEVRFDFMKLCWWKNENKRGNSQRLKATASKCRYAKRHCIKTNIKNIQHVLHTEAEAKKNKQINLYPSNCAVLPVYNAVFLTLTLITFICSSLTSVKRSVICD